MAKDTAVQDAVRRAGARKTPRLTCSPRTKPVPPLCLATGLASGDGWGTGSAQWTEAGRRRRTGHFWVHGRLVRS